MSNNIKKVFYRKVKKKELENKNKKSEIKKDEYTVIRKFNNDGPSFQEVMEQILILRINKSDKD
mgnify:CR=1 FL=1